VKVRSMLSGAPKKKFIATAGKIMGAFRGDESSANGSAH
jgi:hypothetical protein